MKSETDLTIDLLKRAGFDTNTLEIVKTMGDENLDKLLKLRDTARRLVATYVTFVPEQATEAKMAAKLAETGLAKIRGSKEPLASMR